MPNQELHVDIETLKKNLNPGHLRGDTDASDLRKELIEQETTSTEEESKTKELAEDPRSQTPYHLNFTHTDDRGRLWEGLFLVKMLTINEERLSGIMQAQLSGALSYKTLDPYTLEINYVISRLAFGLVEKPSWYNSLLDRVDSFPVLQAIMEEVRSYEEFFRKHGELKIKS